jgi:hypothetical protein
MSESGEGKAVVTIDSLPIVCALKGPMPDGSGGTVSYSNAELALDRIELNMPLIFELGNSEQEKEALEAAGRIVAMVNGLVLEGFLDLLDEAHRELSARGGYRAKNKPQKPIEAPSSL